ARRPTLRQLTIIVKGRRGSRARAIFRSARKGTAGRAYLTRNLTIFGCLDDSSTRRSSGWQVDRSTQIVPSGVLLIQQCFITVTRFTSCPMLQKKELGLTRAAIGPPDRRARAPAAVPRLRLSAARRARCADRSRPTPPEPISGCEIQSGRRCGWSARPATRQLPTT